MSERTFHTLKIETFEPADGGLCVFPPMSRIEAQVQRLKETEDRIVAEQRKALKDGETLPDLPRPSETLLKNQQEARAIAGDRIKVIEFKYRPFTHGEKLAAKRKATQAYTDANGNEAFRLDPDLYELHLVAYSTGMTTEEVEELHPSVFEYLAEEVFGRTQIAPERLSFFASSPTA